MLLRNHSQYPRTSELDLSLAKCGNEYLKRLKRFAFTAEKRATGL